MAKKRRRAKPFVGDKILAVFLLLDSCCCIGATGLLSAAGFGAAAGKTFRSELKKAFPGPGWERLFSPEAGLLLGVVAALMSLLALWFVASIWMGRRWALWCALLLHLPGAVLCSVYGGEARLSALLPIAVTVYLVLRLAGSVGPKT